MRHSVSIVIPTLNRRDFLRDAVTSCRSQSFPSELYEIIIVDNGSTDGTKEMIDQLNCDGHKTVRYLLEQRRGLHWARHAGARVAAGHILAYIDDDCLVEPNWLEELHRAYAALNADAAGGKILIRWDRQPEPWVIQYEPTLGRLDLGPEMMILKPSQYINGGNFSILRSRLFEIGGFNPDQVDDHLIGDGETGLCEKIHKAKWRMVWVPSALAWHRQSVDRNATVRDLRRRFANNGVVSAYATYKRDPKGVFRLMHLGAGSLWRVATNELRRSAYCITRNRDACRHCGFLRAHYVARAACYYRLTWNSRFRQMVLRDDWIND